MARSSPPENRNPSTLQIRVKEPYAPEILISVVMIQPSFTEMQYFLGKAKGV